MGCYLFRRPNTVNTKTEKSQEVKNYISQSIISTFSLLNLDWDFWIILLIPSLWMSESLSILHNCINKKQKSIHSFDYIFIVSTVYLALGFKHFCKIHALFYGLDTYFTLHWITTVPYCAYRCWNERSDFENLGSLGRPTTSLFSLYNVVNVPVHTVHSGTVL